MKPTANPILIGIIAGLVAAILLVASGYATLFSIILAIAAFTSIFIAGMGFGLTGSVVAVLAASVAMAAFRGEPVNFFAAALQLSPAIVMGYLANLARPASELGGPDTAMAWFPLSDIMLAGAVVSAIASSAVILIDPDVDALYSAIADLVGKLVAQTEPQLAGQTPKDQIVAYIRIFFPLIQGWQMMIALFGGFYFAVRILSRTERGARPREDVPASLRMNRLSIVFFLAGVALMFAGDKLEVIGASFAGAIAGGYLLAGYAIVHNLLRDKSYRLPVLIIVYLLSIIVWPLAVVIFLAGGLANPRRAIALTPNKTNPTTDIKN